MKKHNTRRATLDDRKAALAALDRAGIPHGEMAKQLDAYPEKWNLKQCRTAMIRAGMSGTEIDAIFFPGGDGDCGDGEGNAGNNGTDASPTEDAEPTLEPTPDTMPVDDAEQERIEWDRWNRPVTEQALDEAVDKVLEAAQKPHPRLHKIGNEPITATIPLADSERLELASKMANALKRRDELEAEFASVKKQFKADIEYYVEEASLAGAEYRDGSRALTVNADKYECKATLATVYMHPDTGEEIYWRPMTHEERMIPLPLGQPVVEAEKAEATEEAEAKEADQQADGKNCITCEYFNRNGAPFNPICESCSQYQDDNGGVDKWVEHKNCQNCAHSEVDGDVYPCMGCKRNFVEKNHGDEDRWEPVTA